MPRSHLTQTEQNGGVPVNVQDQTTRPLDFYFLQATGAFTTLAAGSSQDDTTLTLTDATGFVDGTYILLTNAATDYFSFATQLGAPAANVITIDTPLDSDVDAGFNVAPLTREMNVDGSVAASTFQVRGGGPGSTIEIDITRLNIQIYTATNPDVSDFGDIATGLTKGIVLRRNNGSTENIWNIKDNGDFAILAYDLDFLDALGQGQAGLKCRYTFAGQEKHGVAVRLSPGDTLDLIIQDDLTDLERFRIMAQGHVVGN